MPDLPSMEAYVERLEVFEDFSRRYYEITAPVARIELYRVADECVEVSSSEPMPETEYWKHLIERAYTLGGGVSVVRQHDGGAPIKVELLQFVIVCQQRHSKRHCFQVLNLAADRPKHVMELMNQGAFALRGLTTIDLSLTRLADKDLAKVLSQVVASQHVALEILKLDDNHIGKASIEILCDWLAGEFCPLKHLSVRNCGLVVLSHFERLIMSIANTSSKLLCLETSNLSRGVDIGDALSPLLESTNLQALYIEQCHVDKDSDILAIGQLMKSTTIKALSLGDCHHLREDHILNLLEVLSPGAPGDGGSNDGTIDLYSLNMSTCEVDRQRSSSIVPRLLDFAQFRLRELDISFCKFISYGSRGGADEHNDSLLHQLFVAVGLSTIIEKFAANKVSGYSRLSFIELLRGVAKLANTGSSKLSVLELAHLPIGDYGGPLLQRMFIPVFSKLEDNNKVLPFTHLDFTGCHISEKDVNVYGYLGGNASIVEEIKMSSTDLRLGCPGLGSVIDPRNPILREKIPPPGFIANKYEPLNLPARYAVLTALSVRDAEGHVRPKFTPEIYRSIFAFSLRPLRRRILVDGLSLYEDE